MYIKQRDYYIIIMETCILSRLGWFTRY